MPHISELPKPCAAYLLPVAGWGETHSGDTGTGFLVEEAEDILCHPVGWGPLGKVTEATSLVPLAPPHSKRGWGLVTPDYILITLSLPSLLFSLGKSLLRGSL